jgi:hypothetical protein
MREKGDKTTFYRQNGRSYGDYIWTGLYWDCLKFFPK